jgi:hypothetical protein
MDRWMGGQMDGWMSGHKNGCSVELSLGELWALTSITSPTPYPHPISLTPFPTILGSLLVSITPNPDSLTPSPWL